MSSESSNRPVTERLRGKTVALTGASGFLGRAVLRRLLAVPDIRLIALGKTRPAALSGNATWLEGPLENLAPERWTASTARIDVLVHLAAATPKRAAEAADIDRVYYSNVQGVRNLFASLCVPVRRVLFASSLDVYSPSTGDSEISERSPIAPNSLYAASKLFGEALARAYSAQRDAEMLVLRIGHVYGPGEQAYHKLIPETIRRLLRGMPPVLIGDGTETRDYLFVEDAAEALLRAAVAPLPDSDILNIAHGESVTVRELLELIAKAAGWTGIIETKPSAAQPRSFVFDTTQMARVLGRWPLIPLAEGLRSEFEDFRRSA